MLVVLLLIIFAIIDFGRLFFVDQSLKAASREGARAAAVRAAWDTTAPTGSVHAVVNNSANAAVALAGGSAAQISGSMSDTGSIADNPASVPCTQARADANTSVTVTVSTPFTWFTPVGIFSSGINSVDASTTMRCE